MAWWNPYTWGQPKGPGEAVSTNPGTTFEWSTREPSDPRIQWFSNNWKIEWTRIKSPSDYLKVFEECSPIAAIITRKAEAFANGSVEVLNATTNNYVRGAYKAWDRLFERPNPLQSKRQFLKQLYTYMQINGYCFALKMYPAGFTDVPTSMWILPPWLIQVDPVNKPYYSISDADLRSNVYFVWDGKRTKLNPKDLMLFCDNTNIHDQYTWLPKSRLYSLRYPITTWMSAVEAEITMIQRKGALGILSNRTTDSVGHVAMAPEEKEALQADYRKYGLTRDQWQLIITNANLEYQSMTFPTKDLMLHESQVKALKDMCDVMNYPFPLSSHSDQSTYNNIQAADRLLYQNAIVPESADIFEQLGRGLNTADQNVLLQMDYSKVPALQQSEEEKGKGRKVLNEALEIEWEAGNITRNQWRERLGEDTVARPEFDKYIWELPQEQRTTRNARQQQNQNGQTQSGQSSSGSA